MSEAPQADPHADVATMYDRCAAGLYRYALMVLADAHLAEDAVQETFARVVAAGRGGGRIASYNGYLRKVMRNLCYDVLRRRRRRRETGVSEMPPLLAAAGASPADEEQRRALVAALCRLPPEQREVVYLKVYEQMTFRRIAELVGVSPNTAVSRYRYALGKLRAWLGGPAGAPGAGHERGR